jgi:hypothetical protein
VRSKLRQYDHLLTAIQGVPTFLLCWCVQQISLDPLLKDALRNGSSNG